jgi:uncharacterized protein (TIGR00725 family)
VTPLYIAVVGSGTASDADLEEAGAVGRVIAEADAVLVCGGLGGVMEAACRGAKSVGGLTVGLLPGTDRRDANPFVDVAVPTGLGEARNALVVRASDALVAVAGEYGTLSEIALALQAGTPVVGLRTWEMIRPGVLADSIVRADEPAEAVSIAIQLAHEARSTR